MSDDPDTNTTTPPVTGPSTPPPARVPAAARPTAAERKEAEAEAGRQPRFTLDRLAGPDGPAIVTSAFDGDPPLYAGSAGVLAGAFHDRDPEGDGFTRAEIKNAVESYLEHVDTSTEA